jgi:hypothetical protein
MYEHVLDMLLDHHPRFLSVGDKSWYRGVLNADLARLDSAGYVIVKKPENGLPVVPEGQMTVDECIAECAGGSDCRGHSLDELSEMAASYRGRDTDCDPED